MDMMPKCVGRKGLRGLIGSKEVCSANNANEAEVGLASGLVVSLTVPEGKSEGR